MWADRDQQRALREGAITPSEANTLLRLLLWTSWRRGALTLLSSLPFAWAVSRIKVSESVKVKIMPAEVFLRIREEVLHG